MKNTFLLFFALLNYSSEAMQLSFLDLPRDVIINNIFFISEEAWEQFRLFKALGTKSYFTSNKSINQDELDQQGNSTDYDTQKIIAINTTLESIRNIIACNMLCHFTIQKYKFPEHISQKKGLPNVSFNALMKLTNHKNVINQYSPLQWARTRLFFTLYHKVNPPYFVSISVNKSQGPLYYVPDTSLCLRIQGFLQEIISYKYIENEDVKASLNSICVELQTQCERERIDSNLVQKFVSTMRYLHNYDPSCLPYIEYIKGLVAMLKDSSPVFPLSFNAKLHFPKATDDYNEIRKEYAANNSLPSDILFKILKNRSDMFENKQDSIMHIINKLPLNKYNQIIDFDETNPDTDQIEWNFYPKNSERPCTNEKSIFPITHILALNQ